MNRSDIRTADGWRGFDRLSWWIAVLLFILLLLLWFFGYGPGSGSACCSQTPAAAPAASVPAPVVPAPVAAPAPAVEAEAGLVFDGSRYRLTGTVKDEATRKALVDAAQAAYGADKVVDELRIDSTVAVPGWLAQAGDLAGLLKGVGAPAAVQIKGSSLTLTGTMPSQPDKDSRGEAARRLVGATGTVNNQLVVVSPAPAATTPVVDCAKLIDGVDLHYSSGSSALSAKGKAMLDAAARCLGTGRYEIAGHTDSIGKPAKNQRLSEARAKGVVTYLMSKGVAGDRLEPKGYGDTKPIADNKAAEGRARNRRTEFVPR